MGNDIHNEKQPLAWHYTVGQRLERIRQDGVIRPATAFVPGNERPIVWFTLADCWEETANKNVVGPGGKVISLDRHGTAAAGGGLYRLGLPLSQLIRWPALAKAAGIRMATRQKLESIARRKGGMPSLWCGSLEAVELGRVVAIEEIDPVSGRSLAK